MSTQTRSTPNAADAAPFRFRSVVVGDDGSAGSRRAARWAVGHVTGDVHVVRAVSPEVELLEAGFQVDSAPMLERTTDDVASAVQALATSLTNVCGHVVEDRVPNALIDTARRFDVDAIVVGTSGHHRFGQIVGANIGRLLHLSDLPVVVVPNSDSELVEHLSGDMPMADIVVGVSADPDADAQLVEWVRSVAPPSGSVRLTYAISPTVLALMSTPLVAETLERNAEARLTGLMGDLPEWRGSVVFEHPLDALVTESQHASLVVVGSHRSSRMHGFVTGSIAQHLPALSECPVAVIPVTAVAEVGSS